jgi:hypothetical protein
MPASQDSSKSYIVDRNAGDFNQSYPGAFSATNIYASILLPAGKPRTLGTLAAISISTHRDKFPVSSMPYVNPRGFTQGHRTIAGTMIFHTIDRNALSYGINRPHEVASVQPHRDHLRPPFPDELPLFDIHITYVNEEGMAAFEALYGVAILDSGKTVSLENLNPIESYSYMAIAYEPMHAIFSGEGDLSKFFLNRTQNRERKSVKVNGRDAGIYDPRLDELNVRP